MVMSRDIKKGSGVKGGAIKPEPEYSRGGSGNTMGKNVPVKYRKIMAISTSRYSYKKEVNQE